MDISTQTVYRAVFLLGATGMSPPSSNWQNGQNSFRPLNCNSPDSAIYRQLDICVRSAKTGLSAILRIRWQGKHECDVD